VDTDVVEGRLMLRRSAAERDPILHRLRRLEGQVRGLQQMVEQDRYCLEEIQQANAVVAAMREVALMIATQHLAVGIEHAAGEQRDVVLADMRAVLRAAMKQA
jgi:DNA-binding FrmR family transcriptional regulator